MLTYDSEEDDLNNNESVGYILNCDKRNTTNLLEFEQSRYFPAHLRYQSNRQSDNRNLNNLVVNKKSDQQLDKLNNNHQSINKLDKTADLTRFDTDIPDELYSILDGKKVFRLFNHVEHIKDDSVSKTLTATKLNSTDKSNMISKENLSREYFRDTQPNESRFCNFLNQTKFDTLLEDERFSDLSDDDEFKTLTESNNLINQQSSKKIRSSFSNESKINQSNYLTYSKDNSKFNKQETSNLVNKRTHNLTSRLIADESSKHFSDYKSIDNTKNDHLNSFNASRNQTLRQALRTSNLLSNLNQNSRFVDTTSSSATLTKISEESLDVFKDFSSNMAKLNETEPSYLKSLDKTLYQSKHLPKIDDDADLSMNFSPIKPFASEKNKFFKTPFKRPLPVSNLSVISEQHVPNKTINNDEQVNKDEFLGDNKLQSTFVDQNDESRLNKISKLSPRKRIDEDSIKDDIEKKLQSMKLKNQSKEVSNLTKKFELAKSTQDDSKPTQSDEPEFEFRFRNSNRSNRSNRSNLSNSQRTSDILEITRLKIEEFKRQQLEKSKLSKTSDNKSKSESIILENKSLAKSRLTYDDQSSNQINQSKQRTFTKEIGKSRFLDRTEAIDQSKLETDKFRLIEEQLKRDELSSRNSSNRDAITKSRLTFTQSLHNLKEKSTRSASSLSRLGDSLGLESTNSTDQALSDSNLNDKTLTCENASLKDQKMYLNFLNTQLIKIKDLEDRSRLIKKRENERADSNEMKQLKTNSTRTITKQQSKVDQNVQKSKLSSSIESLFKTSSSVSPSSIDLSDKMMNLDSILESSDNLSSCLSSVDEENNMNDVNKLVEFDNNLKVNLNDKKDDSFHCKGCRCRKKIVVKIKNLNKNQIKEVPFNRNDNLNDNNNQYAQINRKQTYNKLDILIDRKHFNQQKDQSTEPLNELEESFNVNNRSLDEVFRSKCPKIYSNIQERNNQIKKKIEARKKSDDKETRISKMPKRI